MPRLRRLCAAPLILLLTASPLLAAPHEARRPQGGLSTGTRSVLVEVWIRLVRLWWEKAGSSTDPFGVPQPTASPSPTGNAPEATPAVSPN